MALCLSPETLRLLLDGEVLEPEASLMRLHVESCHDCQAVLDRLSDHPLFREWAGSGRALAAPLTAPVDLLASLRGAPSPPTADTPFDFNAGNGATRLDTKVDAHLGPYEILGELGRGGMGVVLKAFDQELQRLVAVKVLHGVHADARGRERFVREARAAAGLKHDHVVAVYAVASPADGPPYLVMEYVAGPSLLERIKTEGHLQPREAAELCRQAADGLVAAHQARLIHRDIKPANILLEPAVGHRLSAEGQTTSADSRKPAAESRAKITDFGLVRAMEQPGATTQEGAIRGTPEYMSPEQIREPERIDARTDIYSLGVTLYEALTGAVPFRGVPQMVLQQVLHDEPLAPRRLSDRIPRDLETICLKAMAKEPERRYQTAEAMREDLQRWLAGEPIQARPVGQVERAWRWARRRPLVASLSAAVVLAVLMGMGGVLWQWSRAEDRRIDADLQRERAQKRLDHIEKANKFLGSFFYNLDPFVEEKGGPTLRVQLGERISQAAAELDVEAIGDPVTVARLQMVLGASQRGLGYPKEAVARLEQARLALEEHLGVDHADTVQCMHLLARAYDSAGQLKKAVPLYEVVVAKRKEQLGLDHIDTLHSMNNLGLAYWSDGQFDKARPLFEETLARRERVLGLDDADTMKSTNNLANVYNNLGQTDLARQLHEQTLAKLTDKLGPDHPHTLVSMNNLASAYQRLGQLKRALPLFEETLKKRIAKLGPDHPQTMTSVNNLAMAYKADGQVARAIPLFEQNFLKQTEKLGPNHDNTLGTMTNLASAYQANGQLDRALPLFEQALLKMKEHLGPDHPLTLLTTNNLALAYQATEQIERALPLFEEALERNRKKYGPEHSNVLVIMMNLGLAYQDAGQDERAIALLEQALAQFRKKPGPDHPLTLGAMNGLGRAYLEAGFPDRALPLFRETMEKRKANLAPDHPDTLASMHNLARTYQNLGNLDQAQPLFEQTLEKRKVKLGVDHPDTLSTMSSLATAYLAGERRSEALTLIQDVVVRHRQQLAQDELRLAAALTPLGRDLLKYGQYREAEAVLSECLGIRERKQPEAWSTFEIKSLLGGSLLGQMKYALAEPLLVQAYEAMARGEPKSGSASKARLVEALDRLVRHYDATGNRDQAAVWRKKLEEARACTESVKPKQD